MNEVHLIAQAKGGVGKSLISSLVGQYKQDHKQVPTVCVDIDPLNNTFAQFKSLNVAFVDVTESGKTIVPTKFDKMVNAVAESDEDFVIDSGASVFISLMSYLSQDQLLGALADAGKTIFVHTIVVGGQAQSFTVDGLAYLLRDVPDHANIKIVVWKNEHFGHVGGAVDALIEKNAHRIAGVVVLGASESDAFNLQFKEFNDAHQTLKDVSETGVPFATKLRINNFQKNIYGQLDAAVGGAAAPTNKKAKAAG